jgi:hypothetical protein
VASDGATCVALSGAAACCCAAVSVVGGTVCGVEAAAGAAGEGVATSVLAAGICVEASAGAGVLLSWSGVSGRCGWSGENRRLSSIAGLWVAGLWVTTFSVGVVLAAGCVAAASPLGFAEDVSGVAESGFATPVLVASPDASGVCAAGG